MPTLRVCDADVRLALWINDAGIAVYDALRLEDAGSFWHVKTEMLPW